MSTIKLSCDDACTLIMVGKCKYAYYAQCLWPRLKIINQEEAVTIINTGQESKHQNHFVAGQWKTCM